MTESEKKPLILIVDDVSKNLQVLAGFLQEDNYRLALATNGQDALRLVLSQKPDLVVLDIMMPDMDGYEVCRRIKQDPLIEKVPVIFLTARTETEDIVKGFELGAVDYVKKPVNKYELLARVRTHLSLSKTMIELSIAKDDLEKNNNQKDRFISILAHDLKNPIHAQMGLSKLMLGHIDKMSPDDIRENVSHLHHSAESISRLLEDLLTWARAQMGKFDFHPDYYDVRVMVNETIRLLESSLKNKEITLISLFTDPIEVFIDIQMMMTVLRNLLSNAVKFTPRGGEISLYYEIINIEMIISVKDNGVGIRAENLDRLFVISSMVRTAGTESETGTGLGLLLCKEFVERNGGRIKAVSQPGIGSTFSFSVPVRD